PIFNLSLDMTSHVGLTLPRRDGLRHISGKPVLKSVHALVSTCLLSPRNAEANRPSLECLGFQRCDFRVPLFWEWVRSPLPGPTRLPESPSLETERETRGR